MKKVALLVFGQFRTASVILEHNLKEIKNHLVIKLIQSIIFTF